MNEKKKQIKNKFKLPIILQSSVYVNKNEIVITIYFYENIMLENLMLVIKCVTYNNE